MTHRLIVAAALLAFLFPAPAPGQVPAPIELTLPLREGDVRISGRGGAAKSVMVRVYSGWVDEVSSERAIAAKARLEDNRKKNEDPAAQRAIICQIDEPVATVGPSSVTDGKFDVLLPRRLNGGDCVVVEDATTLKAGETKAASASAIVRSVILDLGRVRGYFSLGGAISRNRNAFAQTDNFVGFTVDARVVGWTIAKPCEFDATKEPDPAKEKERAAKEQWVRDNCELLSDGKYREVGRSMRLRSRRVQINAFADARVGFKLAAGTASTATTGGTPAQPPFQRPDQLVFNADQPGYFEIGTHIPISFAGMDWRNNGRLYSFYFGPVAKYGAQSFGSPVLRSRTVTVDLTKPATDTARYTTTAETSESGAQPFYGVGGRIGVFGYDLLGQELRHRQVANDPVAYLDITWGRATGFPTYQFTRATSADGKTETVTIDSDTRRRLTIAGRMKIPYLPALVGLDYNVRANNHSEEPNEFRFIVAFRVDAQKALGRVFGGDALTQDR